MTATHRRGRSNTVTQEGPDQVSADHAREALLKLSEEEQRKVLVDVFVNRLEPERGTRLAAAINENLPLSQKKSVILRAFKSLRPLPARVSVIVRVVEDLPEDDEREQVARLALETHPYGAFLATMISTWGLHALDTAEKIKAALTEETKAPSSREEGETGLSVVVHFTDKAYGVIKELQDKSRTAGSLSAVLTQALAFEKWYRDAIAAGNRVYVP
jgi:hypothetical protein